MDFDEALAATATVKGPKCTLCKFLDSLDEDQRAKVQAALDSDRQQSWVARALGKMTGDEVWNSRGSMIGTHRARHS